MSLAGSLFKLTSMMRTWRRDDDDVHGLDDLASAIAFIVQADALSVLLVDEENQVPQLVLRGNYGLAPVDVSLIRFQLGKGWRAKFGNLKRLPWSMMSIKTIGLPLCMDKKHLWALCCLCLCFTKTFVWAWCAPLERMRAFYDTDKETLAKVATSLAQDLSQGNYYKNAVTDSLTGLKNVFSC